MSYIGGDLVISSNNALTNLIGLESVDTNSIRNLTIWNNPVLSTCEIQGIFNYLSKPYINSSIEDNAPGCNSQEEINDSCEVHAGYIDLVLNEYAISIFPNPANDKIQFKVDGLDIDEIKIYTLTKQQVIAIRPVNETVNISTLPTGMYIVEVTVENRKLRQKLLVQR